MTTDIDKLAQQMREAAGKASPGPWFVHDFSALAAIGEAKAQDITVSCDHPATITVAAMGGGLHGHTGVEQAQLDARHIAASHPAAVLALLDDRDGLREALLEARNALSVAKDALDQCYDVTEWPADGTSDQDAARVYCASAFSRAEAALATSGGGNG